GAKRDRLFEIILQPDWRAGFLRSCRLALPRRQPMQLLAAFLDTPASSVLNALSLDLSHVSDLNEALRALKVLAPSLRSLEIDCRAGQSIDGALFEPLGLLRHLVLPAAVTKLGNLPHLERLFIHLDDEISARTVFDTALPALTSLDVDALAAHDLTD